MPSLVMLKGQRRRRFRLPAEMSIPAIPIPNSIPSIPTRTFSITTQRQPRPPRPRTT